MISLKNLKMKKIELFSSKEDMERVFSSLEEKTKDSFAAFADAKRRSYCESHSIVLD